jgi:hypothetical protein
MKRFGRSSSSKGPAGAAQAHGSAGADARPPHRRYDNSSDAYLDWTIREGQPASSGFKPEVRASDTYVYPTMIGTLLVGTVCGVILLQRHSPGIEQAINAKLNAVVFDYTERAPLPQADTDAAGTAIQRDPPVSLKEYRFERDDGQQAAADALAEAAFRAVSLQYQRIGSQL